MSLRTNVPWLLCSCALASLGAACGESDGSGGAGGTGGVDVQLPECREAIDACGGDPTGRWRVAGWCGAITRVARFGDSPECEGQPYEQSFEAVEGHFDYRPDGTLQTDMYLELGLTHTVTPSCATYWVGQGVTGEVCRAFQRSISGSPGVSGTLCEPTDDGGCRCVSTFIDDREESLPWNLAGGVLHEGDAAVAHCVRDGVLVRSPALADDPDDWITGLFVRDEPDPALACEGETAACGGDPVGRWAFAGACGSVTFGAPIATSDACQDQPAEFRFDDAEGTVEYRADGTVTTAVRYELDFRLQVTPACVDDLAAQLGDACAAVRNSYAGAGYTGVSCVATDEDGCSCTATLRQEAAETRTWSLEGGVLHDGTAAYVHCIDGDVFRRSGDAMEGGVGRATEVLVRQAGQ